MKITSDTNKSEITIEFSDEGVQSHTTPHRVTMKFGTASELATKIEQLLLDAVVERGVKDITEFLNHETEVLRELGRRIKAEGLGDTIGDDDEYTTTVDHPGDRG